MRSQPAWRRSRRSGTPPIPLQLMGKHTVEQAGGQLAPLIWEHVNPYGRFELDMEARLPID
jgi:hypothetical protein